MKRGPNCVSKPENARGLEKKKKTRSSTSEPLSSSPPKTSLSLQLKPRADYLLCDVADIEKTNKNITSGGANTSEQQPATTPSSGDDAVALGHGFGAACDFAPTLRQFRLRGCGGDTVLYSSRDGRGCIDVTMGGDPHVMLHDSKVVGIVPGAAAGDAAGLRPFGDRVLFRVQPGVAAAGGGLPPPASAKGRPIVGGVVVAVGPGRRAGAHARRPDERAAPAVGAGDLVACLEGAGDELESPRGERYVVVHESDILCKQG